jgi:hypothetical protein
MANSKMLRKLAIHAQSSTFARSRSVRDVHDTHSQTERLEVEERHVGPNRILGRAVAAASEFVVTATSMAREDQMR